MYCPNCGNEAAPHAVVCIKCGGALGPMPAQVLADPLAKSRLAYILLGALLGTLGIHNFYAGYVGQGIAQLLITLLSCGFGAIISMVWAIVEICTVTVDSTGRPFAP